MPADEHESMSALSDDQIQQFIQDGFVRIDRAFPREIADEARAILWRDTGCDPDDPATWTNPVIRLSGCKDAAFLKAERTPVLRAAFDQIIGKGPWRLGSLGFGGMFVVRFPHPGDDGWHTDRHELSSRWWRSERFLRVAREREVPRPCPTDAVLVLRRRPAGRADADTGRIARRQGALSRASR